jgi:hypothetical protein
LRGKPLYNAASRHSSITNRFLPNNQSMKQD